MKNLLLLFVVTPLICLGQVLEDCENISSALPDLIFCDDDSDGSTVFDLTVTNADILSGQDPSNYNISFHLTQTDAENNASPATTNGIYTNDSNPQVIYTRTTDTDNTCLSISSFSLIVEESPFLEPILDQEICNCDNTSPVLFNYNNPNISANWETAGNSYLSGWPSSGTGNIDSFALCNLTTSPQTISIVIYPFNVVNGCWGDALDFSVTVLPVEDCTASVTDPSFLNFSIYPNPVKDYLNIDYSNSERISIYNILGKEVIRIGNQNTVDVSTLSKGVYFIKVSDGVNSSTKKFIKN